MNTTQQTINELRRQLEVLHNAVVEATRQGDVRRQALLMLQACKVRRSLIEAQAQMFD